ncbi:MAG TPA: 23S rRNA (adenine(2503)-C(2))-methyltransferase RlmN [Armatimonadota bacterium]|nr:23S rRNA (adenine(2503)-C(2))-methyltransferase RlmN [Armatimonadota bacterium]
MGAQRQAAYLLGMTIADLEALAESLGERKFRGRQLASWLYKRNAAGMEEMLDLPASFRARLSQEGALYRSRVAATSDLPDGTSKFLLELEDAQRIETVLLPYESRVSVCVSTQVGCAAGCTFCATGMDGLVRNLTAGEIIDQALTVRQQSARRVSHVVYMGMGEPLLNYDPVVRSIRILNCEVGIAMRHIAVSTVGITPRIEKLAAEKLQIALAVSLHAPNDQLRRQIVPIAERYPLEELLAACRQYADYTRRRITFEYLLIRGLNDSLHLAHELVAVLRGILCNVNLIPYNAVQGLPLSRPSQARIGAFRSVLECAGIAVTQRVERGHAVSAACGQLRLRTSPEGP